ncbi:universal stress protein [Herbiconiux sp. 11R-BC]|uniref:universal stress protein n=1 Tax=Herbiconiux sp. 11R-BC TaxID=3111637 RepID=UPI003C04DBB2
MAAHDGDSGGDGDGGHRAHEGDLAGLSLVVAYDGGPSSEAALAWAVRLADSGGHPLTLVFVREGAVVLPAKSSTVAAVSPGDQLVERARRIRMSAPALTVGTRVVVGEVVAELVRLTGPGSLVVVGAGSHRLLHAPARWSLCVRLAAHAHGPVAVVPSETTEAGSGIVVGVDGGDDSLALAEFAARWAREQNTGLRLVHAWLPPVMVLNPYPLDAATLALVEAPHQEFTARLAAAIQRDHPSLRVESATVRSRAATALAAGSRPPLAVVVGRRARSALATSLLGSTSRDMLLNLGSPVVIVPARAAAVAVPRLDTDGPR